MKDNKITVGWREWVSLPELNIEKIKAKVDTGAKTSCLHAFEITPYNENGINKVKFLVHPLQKNNDIVKECHAELLDKRYVIQTRLVTTHKEWDIEMTLTNRDTMLFRMLLGRRAMENILVDPSSSYLLGKNKWS
jgi:hypothetical protein